MDTIIFIQIFYNAESLIELHVLNRVGVQSLVEYFTLSSYREELEGGVQRIIF
jgi:hypothetical protein